jgi:hypothetical protein
LTGVKEFYKKQEQFEKECYTSKAEVLFDNCSNQLDNFYKNCSKQVDTYKIKKLKLRTWS